MLMSDVDLWWKYRPKYIDYYLIIIYIGSQYEGKDEWLKILIISLSEHFLLSFCGVSPLVVVKCENIYFLQQNK
jgi:hypothetical protein